MRHSQFEKVLSNLDKKHQEVERLRGLVRKLVDNASGGDEGEIVVRLEDFNELENEVTK